MESNWFSDWRNLKLRSCDFIFLFGTILLYLYRRCFPSFWYRKYPFGRRFQRIHRLYWLISRCREHQFAIPNVFTSQKPFGANSGNSYGLVYSPSNNQLDWSPDGQAFRVIYLGINSNGYIASGAGGTGNGYTPSTMAIWAKMPEDSITPLTDSNFQTAVNLWFSTKPMPTPLMDTSATGILRR